MLKIFNTFSGKTENFFINDSNKANIYVCGITPSDFIHIGHARTFIIFDIIRRYLNYIGYKTFYIRNITDISEKIFKKSTLNKENFFFYIEKIIKDMNNNCELLNILKPDCELKISSVVQQSIFLIKKLLKNNFAYITQKGDIRFDIRKFEKYGQLSKQKINNLSYKKISTLDKSFMLDFVLWKNLIDKQDINSFNSPWGKGNIGWHTGCFTIIHEFFKKKNISVDIHGGGNDLIFPHHENELAQYESLYKKPYVKYWVHIGLILINNKKMSKSLNNFYSLKDIFKIFHPEILKAFFINSHYRKNINFCEKTININKKLLEKLYLTLRKKNNNYFFIESDLEQKYEKFFIQSMNNDFNTVQCFSILLEMSKKINILYLKKKYGFANSLSIKLKKLANILGLLYQDPECFFKNISCKLPNIDYIEYLINIRNNARNTKNWNLADKIRQKLNKLNILLEDDIYGTKWRVS